jgi:fructose-bisphosphate aldolase, class I
MERLSEIAGAMVAKGKGILAADESTGTIKKRFDKFGVESTAESRRDYREMLFRTPAMREHISGVILYEETLRQAAADGTPIADVIKSQGAMPGIKVDTGAKPLALHPGETVTEGLDGLRERLGEFYGLGARFAKWRAVLKIAKGMPSQAAVSANAHALARYAALCQEAGLVPIVEPEVLMDGEHAIDVCAEVTEHVLSAVFASLHDQGVKLEGVVLKPNMVLAGEDCPTQPGVKEVAEKTLKVLKRTVPSSVPGIVFLSGGQSDLDATARLNMMNQMGPQPWHLSFSYGRALQATPLKTWAGQKANVKAAQAAFAHRARMNGLAAQGQWSPALEQEAA